MWSSLPAPGVKKSPPLPVIFESMTETVALGSPIEISLPE